MNIAAAQDSPIAFPAPTDRYVDLPLHVFDISTRCCIFCGDRPTWDSFEEYVEFWFAKEYEGEPGHTHEDQEDWEYVSASCLKAG